jgi:hypothetical protein
MCITWGMWGGYSISRSTWHWEEAKFLCIWFVAKVDFFILTYEVNRVFY